MNAKFFNLNPSITYATRANAIKAVEKKFGPDDKNSNITYIISITEAGRFFPVFIGERAIQAGVHFHFCVVN